MKPVEIPQLLMSDFAYELPAELIAERPLERRDDARLLVFDGNRHTISHCVFNELPTLLPPNSLLIANTSRVVAARLHAHKSTGGLVEILLTEPIEPSTDPQIALSVRGFGVWHCLIGGRNVHPGAVLQTVTADEGRSVLAATLTVREKHDTEGVVELRWDPEVSLTELLRQIGHIPLPPYIKRDDDDDDKYRYQTVFAKDEGSVAAPTAGLHFTVDVLTALKEREIAVANVTLHVGLGTFQPVDVADARDHVMHAERIEVDRADLQLMIEQLQRDRSFITCVGTTSLRTVESIYWFGARLLRGHSAPEILCEQFDAFDSVRPPALDALAAVAQWMDDRGLDKAWGHTSLMLAPGCSINVADALVTNFHQPGNTLLMLVASFVGSTEWRSVYEAALTERYRLLSYGDSSLLIRSR